MLDPVNFEQMDDGSFMLPKDSLTASDRSDSISDVLRVAEELGTDQLIDLCTSGVRVRDEFEQALLKQCTARETEVLQNGKEVIKFPSVATRRKLWANAMLEGMYPELSVAANMYLSVHASSCANFSHLQVRGVCPGLAACLIRGGVDYP
jgi:hypothetical protein